MTASPRRRPPLPVQPEDLARLSSELGVELSASELAVGAAWAESIVMAAQEIDSLRARNPVEAGERSFRQPSPSEDRFAAISYLCDVSREGLHGALTGIRVGIKDLIPVRGIPLESRSGQADEVIPSEDATVVQRLIDAGATIAAKTRVGSPDGVTRNPLSPEHSPGYSSSGSAASVASGDVDVALGTDGAGSVRIPAAWCGLVGVKPTAGLVPQHAGLSRHTEIGPITTTPAENVKILDVIAGEDWRHPSCGPLRTRGWSPHPIERSTTGLTVGIVRESTDTVGATAETRACFSAAQQGLQELGMSIRSVAIPLWPHAPSLYWLLMDLLELEATLGGEPLVSQYAGWLDAGLARGLRQQASTAPERKMLHLLGEHLRALDVGFEQFMNARNTQLELGREIDDALGHVDVLVTPTTPIAPFELTDPRLRDAREARTLLARTIANTVPLNLTGHPAVSVPVGSYPNGLPFGLQIIAKRLDEHLLYRIAEGLARQRGSPRPDGLAPRAEKRSRSASGQPPFREVR